jgi:hypothetical protein
MMSDKWTEKLSDYLDGELTEADRAELGRHLETCADCRAALEQLRDIVGWADDYPGRQPERDVWPGISAAISDMPRGAVNLDARRRERRQVMLSIPQALAAGIALAVVGAGSWWLARETAPQTQMAAVIDISAREAGSTVAATIFTAQKYGPAIADLEGVLLGEEGVLDSVTVRVLREKLAIIDRALAEAQDALARDPASDFLADHYTGMMKKKLRVLRGAARQVEVSS